MFRFKNRLFLAIISVIVLSSCSSGGTVPTNQLNITGNYTGNLTIVFSNSFVVNVLATFTQSNGVSVANSAASVDASIDVNSSLTNGFLGCVIILEGGTINPQTNTINLGSDDITLIGIVRNDTMNISITSVSTGTDGCQTFRAQGVLTRDTSR